MGGWPGQKEVRLGRGWRAGVSRFVPSWFGSEGREWKVGRGRESE